MSLGECISFHDAWQHDDRCFLSFNSSWEAKERFTRCSYECTCYVSSLHSRWSFCCVSLLPQVYLPSCFFLKYFIFFLSKHATDMNELCKTSGKGWYVVKHSQRKDGRNYISLQMEMVQKWDGCFPSCDEDIHTHTHAPKFYKPDCKKVIKRVELHWVWSFVQLEHIQLENEENNASLLGFVEHPRNLGLDINFRLENWTWNVSVGV